MDIHFLDPIADRSPREHELQDAIARSHAAKVSNRRKNKRPTIRTRQSFPIIARDTISGHAQPRNPEWSAKYADLRRYASYRQVYHNSIMVYHGNSDPFDSLPIPVHPVTNLYLNFGSEHVGALVRGIDPPDLMMSPGRAQLAAGAPMNSSRRIWPLFEPNQAAEVKYMISSDLFGGQLELYKLASTPTTWVAVHANSVLAYCATALWTVSGNPRHQSNALSYTSACISGLRNQLDQNAEQTHFRIEELVYRLLRADLLAQNFGSASIHMRYLQQVFKKSAKSGTLDLESLTMAMHSDNNMAVAVASRPVFESDWLQEVFSQSWQAADMLFQFDVSYDLQYHAANPSLQKILIAENKFFHQSSLLRLQRTKGSQQNWHLFVSQREWLQNCLLHEYVTATGKEDGSPSQKTTSFVEMLLNKCLNLAALIALRNRKRVSTVGRVTLYGASVAMLKRINTLVDALEQATEDWFVSHTEPLLWITFVLALEEHKIESGQLVEKNKPCLQRLRRYIMLAGLQSWSSLQNMLGMFPYTELEMPLPHKDWLADAFVDEQEQHIDSLV